MKRLLLISLLSAGILPAMAQTDDIYATGRDQGAQASDSNRNRQNNYSDARDNSMPDNYQNYNNPDDYIDNEDESYGTRMRRFDDPRDLKEQNQDKHMQ